MLVKWTSIWLVCGIPGISLDSGCSQGQSGRINVRHTWTQVCPGPGYTKAHRRPGHTRNLVYTEPGYIRIFPGPASWDPCTRVYPASGSTVLQARGPGFRRKHRANFCPKQEREGRQAKTTETQVLSQRRCRRVRRPCVRKRYLTIPTGSAGFVSGAGRWIC